VPERQLSIEDPAYFSTFCSENKDHSSVSIKPRAAEEMILMFRNFLLLNQQMLIDSKELPITLPTIEEILPHIFLATTVKIMVKA
jgi:hypothetical protein